MDCRSADRASLAFAIWGIAASVILGANTSCDGNTSDTASDAIAPSERTIEIRNGSFEESTEGYPAWWGVLAGRSEFVQVSEAESQSGGTSLRTGPGYEYNQISQQIPFEHGVRGDEYTLSAFVKYPTFDGARIMMQLSDGTKFWSEPNTGQKDWERLEATAIVTGEAEYTGCIAVLTHQLNPPAPCYFDAVELRVRNLSDARFREESFERWTNGLPLRWRVVGGAIQSVARSLNEKTGGGAALEFRPASFGTAIAREASGYGKLPGRLVRVEANVKSSNPRTVYLVIDHEDFSMTHSAPHKGDGNWDRLRVSHRVPAHSVFDRFDVRILVGAPRDAPVYVDDLTVFVE